mmetsp:Transcript_2913/g.3071  ORF Transcript_2913/g.3071 Transcript_2913/m.3071 type:complete len:200 (-) Transcript_2913:27-626(-)
MSRVEYKTFTNLPDGKKDHQDSEVALAEVEQISHSSLPRWADQSGAFDKSDIIYLHSQMNEKKLLEEAMKRQEDNELMNFRMSSRATASSSNVVSFAVKEKKEVTLLAAPHITVKSRKRKVEDMGKGTVKEKAKKTVDGQTAEDKCIAQKTASVIQKEQMEKEVRRGPEIESETGTEIYSGEGLKGLLGQYDEEEDEED